MEQGEQEHVQRRQPRPAVGGQQHAQFRKAAVFGQRAGRGVGHENDRDDDFVGGEAEHKRHQNDAVQPQQPAERVERARKVRQQRAAAHGDVCQRIDQQAGRRRDAGRPRQHKQRAVERGAHQHPADLRDAIGRQLQREGRWNAAQQRFGQEPGGGERHSYAQQDGGGEQQGGAARSCRPCEKHADHRRKHGEAAVAGDERVGQNGDQPLARAVDDPAPDYPRRIAPKAHAHGWLITECERWRWGGCRCSANTPRPPARAVSPADLWGSSMLHTVSENDYRQRLESISLRPRQSSARQ